MGELVGSRFLEPQFLIPRFQNSAFLDDADFQQGGPLLPRLGFRPGHQPLPIAPVAVFRQHCQMFYFKRAVFLGSHSHITNYTSALLSLIHI